MSAWICLGGVFFQKKLIQFSVPVHENLSKQSALFCGQAYPQLNKISNYFWEVSVYVTRHSLQKHNTSPCVLCCKDQTIKERWSAVPPLAAVTANKAHSTNLLHHIVSLFGACCLWLCPMFLKWEAPFVNL